MGDKHVIFHKFQFHYGTIKRKSQHRQYISRTYFNSTMVRLKVLVPCGKCILCRFQFHYGTIKRKSTNYALQYIALFQFHYGTIKRPQSVEQSTTASAFQFHYGTIKSHQRQPLQAPELAFQFHYGTIKRRKSRSSFCLVTNFNSTMVRLKVYHKFQASAAQAFQFHYGTIKSVETVIRSGLLSRFQFHYGTIKSRETPCSRPKSGKKFQFHYGTIKRRPMRTPRPMRYYFNSTMVRLKAMGTCESFYI